MNGGVTEAGPATAENLIKTGTLTQTICRPANHQYGYYHRRTQTVD